jgi:hypothetical protein
MAETKKKANSYTKTIIYCGGSKGGCAKSLGAGSITDALLGLGRQVTLVDCDAANADSRLWCGSVANSGPQGKEGGGPLLEFVEAPVTAHFGPLVDAICAAKSPVVVVNPGAGDARLFCDTEASEPMLSAAVVKYKWRFILLYFLTPTHGSIRPLLGVADSCHKWAAEIMVLRNLFFSPEHFQIWDKLSISATNKQTVQSAVRALGATESDWPVLAPPVVLAALDANWVSLRHYQASKMGAAYFQTERYRNAVMQLVNKWSL